MIFKPNKSNANINSNNGHAERGLVTPAETAPADIISRRSFLKKSLVAGGAVLSATSLPGVLLAAGLVSENSFDDDSTAEEVTAGLDLTGKTILVTGANSGIGFETMRVLAMRGAHVLAACRTIEKGRRAIDRVKETTAISGKITPLACELSKLDSVAACAEEASRLTRSLDAVICNAGIMQLPELQQVNGIEKQFYVNYLGHFLLCRLLEQPLKSAEQGRIVMVSSGYYRKAPDVGIEFDNLSGQRGYDPLTAYGQSKLAQALFCIEYARRNPGSTVTANAIHPGVIRTNLARHLPWYTRFGFWLFGWTFTKTVEEGAATQTYVATHPTLSKTSGHFFVDCGPEELEGPFMKDKDLPRKLWEASEKLVSPYI